MEADRGFELSCACCFRVRHEPAGHAVGVAARASPSLAEQSSSDQEYGTCGALIKRPMERESGDESPIFVRGIAIRQWEQSPDVSSRSDRHLGFRPLRRPLFVDSGYSFSFCCLGTLSSLGGEDAPRLGCFDRLCWGARTRKGLPQAQKETHTIAHCNRASVHLWRRLVWRSSAIAYNRSCDHHDRQRVYDRSPQDQSHLLPRLRLQPLRLMMRLNLRNSTAAGQCSKVGEYRRQHRSLIDCG